MSDVMPPGFDALVRAVFDPALRARGFVPDRTSGSMDPSGAPDGDPVFRRPVDDTPWTNWQVVQLRRTVAVAPRRTLFHVELGVGLDRIRGVECDWTLHRPPAVWQCQLRQDLVAVTGRGPEPFELVPGTDPDELGASAVRLLDDHGLAWLAARSTDAALRDLLTGPQAHEPEGNRPWLRMLDAQLTGPAPGLRTRTVTVLRSIPVRLRRSVRPRPTAGGPADERP